MPFVLRSTYDLAIAERDGARDMVEHYVERVQFWREISTRHAADFSRANAELTELRARLAKWEGPRERDDRGRFVSGKRKAVGE